MTLFCYTDNCSSFGVFRLTDPPGVDIISNCKETPAFHPHPDLPIYTVSFLSLFIENELNVYL
jgi:STAM-binding protein